MPVVKPTSNVCRAPEIVWASTSWPWPLVPSQCSQEGGRSGVLRNAVGSCVMKGPNSARKMKRKMMTTPVIAFRFWRMPVIQREKMLLLLLSIIRLFPCPWVKKQDGNIHHPICSQYRKCNCHE